MTSRHEFGRHYVPTFKAAFVPGQIRDRMAKGARHLEMQLLSERVDDTFVESCLEMTDGIDVMSVHSPLTTTFGDTEIENAYDHDAVVATARLASAISDREHHDVAIVVHLSHSVDDLTRLGVLWQAVDSIGEASSYRGVRIGIEHVPMVQAPASKEYAPRMFESFRSTRSGEWHASCVDLATRAREMGIDGVGVVLDTCHLMIAERQLPPIMELVGHDFDVDAFEDDVLSEMVPLLSVVHLSSARGIGFGPGAHGTPFDDESAIDDLVRRLVSSNMSSTCVPIVYETGEPDQLDATNMSLVDRQWTDSVSRVMSE